MNQWADSKVHLSVDGSRVRRATRREAERDVAACVAAALVMARADLRATRPGTVVRLQRVERELHFLVARGERQFGLPRRHAGRPALLPDPAATMSGMMPLPWIDTPEGVK